MLSKLWATYEMNVWERKIYGALECTVEAMPLNEATISIFFSMQFYHHILVGFPTKPKKS